MAILKELKPNFIPTGGYYSSHAWYLSIGHVMERILRVRDGRRELQDFVELDYPTDDAYLTALTAAVKDNIDMLFIVNDESYSRIYRALVTEDYNPLWNVDGKETLEYTRDNTGTQDNTVDHTGTQGNARTNTGTQTNKLENRGTQTNVTSNTGTQTDSTTHTGTQTNTDATGSTNTEYKTTFDSSSEKETQKNVVQNTGNTTRSDNLTDSHTRTDNLSENNTRTDNLDETATRTDNLTENMTRTDNLKDAAKRTDNLKETYTETKIRGGNIGLTMPNQLIEGELSVRLNRKFLEIVEHDIITSICYSC